jgi:hypothetical protein
MIFNYKELNKVIPLIPAVEPITTQVLGEKIASSLGFVYAS